MSKTMIPFNRPSVQGREMQYVQHALAAGRIAGDGAFTKQCQALLEHDLGVARAFLTTSCTHALELAALLLDFEPGDEIIVPSFTFVSTANAFVLRGARPVFADIRPDTLNIDESLLPELITPRTRAVIAMHYAGVGCEMEAILGAATRHGLAVVEDNAHGLFGRYRGRYLGTFGALATQSFHETKNFTCGEGGALLVNDASLVERAEVLREKGTNRSRFFRGEIDKYTWVDVGSSYLPSDMLAAFLLAQLERREHIQTRREVLWQRYRDGLEGWAADNRVVLPKVPAHCDQSFHIFYVLLPDLATRQALIAHLRERGVFAVFHYIPLHLSAMGRRFGGSAGDCPVSEDVSERLVRLPLFNAMTDAEQEAVIDRLRCFRC